MQFREQGKKVQCIRSSYDQASKRSHQKVIATFDRQADKISSECLSLLTAVEQQELNKWFAARQLVTAEKKIKAQACSGAQTLADLAKAITAERLTAEQASDIWRGLAAVAKSLRKAGHAQPKRRASTASKKPQALAASAADAANNNNSTMQTPKHKVQ